MDKLYSEIYSRNIGIINESEQEKLRQSTIAIAGVGGVGGLLAERLIRIGVGRLKIADPGTFEKSNFNRQFGASMTSLGHSKTETVFHQIKDINPQATIEVNTTGIKSEDDAIRFVGDADLVIDEMDFGLFKQSIGLQRAARQRGIYYFFTSAIGFGALVVIFAPQGLTLEEFDNVPVNVDLNSIEKIHVAQDRVMPVIPSYSPIKITAALQEIYTGERTVPTIGIGVGLASILAANEAVNIILHRREIAVAPRYTYIDLLDRQFVVGKIS